MRQIGAGDGRAPRPITPAIRAALGLPTGSPSPYPWAFATVVVVIACVPLGLASLWTACFLAIAIGFVVLPFFRWFEHRDGAWREDVYRYGVETNGRVLEVEPPGSARADHLIRIEFRAGSDIVRASILGFPPALRSLAPEEEIVILYAADSPTRCLVVRKLFDGANEGHFAESARDMRSRGVPPNS